MVVPGGQVRRGVLTAGTPMPLNKLAGPPAAPPSPRPGPPRIHPAPVTPGRIPNLRPVNLAPCLRAITVIDAAGCHRLDHLLGDDQ